MLLLLIVPLIIACATLHWWFRSRPAPPPPKPRPTPPLPEDRFWQTYRGKRGKEQQDQKEVDGLSSPDSTVRYKAASALLRNSNRHQRWEKPVIAALHNEALPGLQIRFAECLLKVGNPAGTHFLQAMCADLSLPAAHRVAALHKLARDRPPLGGGATIASYTSFVLPAFDAATSHAERWAIVQLFPRIHLEVPAHERARMVAIAESWMDDKSGWVRADASLALYFMSSISSIDLLRRALDREQNPMWRQNLIRYVQGLEALRQASTRLAASRPRPPNPSADPAPPN